MEKFGIFELLDTISAIMATKPQTKDQKQPSATEENIAGAEKITPKQTDGAFAPPPNPAKENFQAAAQASAERNAFNSFLERHDSISKKIDKNS